MCNSDNNYISNAGFTLLVEANSVRYVYECMMCQTCCFIRMLFMKKQFVFMASLTSDDVYYKPVV